MYINLSPEMIRSVRNIESVLIDAKFDLLSEGNNRSRLAVKEIHQAISGYLKNGEILTSAPDDYIKSVKAIVVNNSSVPSWHVDYDLWINNKHSDLTVSLKLIKEDDKFVSYLEDIHVM